MVDRVDALTRLNRAVGVGQVMISHTMSDLLALPAEEDRMKGRGFFERSGMVICGGLPASEMPLLTAAIPLSRVRNSRSSSSGRTRPPGTTAAATSNPPDAGNS